MMNSGERKSLTSRIVYFLSSLCAIIFLPLNAVAAKSAEMHNISQVNMEKAALILLIVVLTGAILLCAQILLTLYLYQNDKIDKTCALNRS